VLPAEFESATALGSEVRPHLRSSEVNAADAGVDPAQSGAAGPACHCARTHKSRTSEGALTKPSLGAKKRAPFSPYQGKRITAELGKEQG
jgi:hypothetical protein